jgi:3-oxoacyl-[acyl-carrier-protein] synthase II
VVITGIGLVSPIGIGTDVNWRALMEGRSGIGPITHFDAAAFSARIAGEVKGFDPLQWVEKKDVKKMDVFIQYGLGAADEALRQSGWVADTPQKQAVTGTIIGSGVGGSPVMAEAVETIMTKGPRRLSPFTVPSFLANLAAGWISIKYGFKGPIGAPVTACAASAQAIGDAMRLIRTGEAEVMVCGGAEGSVDPISIGGFAASRALDTSHNDTPTEASRPFDKGHSGFVLSEGAAVVVIEKLSHALARGAKPLAIAAGYGTSADAYHLTAGSPDGAGAQVAMNNAIRNAGLNPDDIGYVNAHATSTEVGDNAEINGIRAVFGDRGQSLAVSSTKSSTGHMLGAAGAIEAVISILALRHQMLPPTLNLHDPEEVAKQFDLVPLKAKAKALKHVLSNSFGFGGVNASLVFSAV